MKDDKKFVLEAVKQDGDVLYYASDRLKDDKEVVLEAVKQNGKALRFASDRLKDDEDVVLAAVKQDGKALRYASKNFVLEAVKQNREALRLASDKLKDDKDIVLEAVKKDGEALGCASERLKEDKDVLNSMRDYLMSDAWNKIYINKKEVFVKAKENLLRYDAQDREEREKELLSKLADLDKLQAQQNSNQEKTQIRTKRKL